MYYMASLSHTSIKNNDNDFIIASCLLLCHPVQQPGDSSAGMVVVEIPMATTLLTV